MRSDVFGHLNMSPFLGSLPGELDPSQGSIAGINNQETIFKEDGRALFFCGRAPFQFQGCRPLLISMFLGHLAAPLLAEIFLPLSVHASHCPLNIEIGEGAGARTQVRAKRVLKCPEKPVCHDS